MTPKMIRLAAAGLVIAVTGAFLATAEARAEGWPRCGRDDGCGRLYLNIVSRQGEARLRVSDSCGAGWRHSWGRADARSTIRQWLNGESRRGAGSLCIRLAPQVDEIRITAIGGHCGYDAGEANTPGPGIVLRRGYGSSASTGLIGCHASIGDVAFGGVALDFADGYGFGDSYAEGYFYGVYDGWRTSGVSPFGASVWSLSQFNTFHYRVEILANGSGAWRADFEENGR